MALLAHAGLPPHPTLARFTFDWHFDPFVVGILFALGALYLRASAVLASRRRWPRSRTAAFLSGLLVIAFATLGGIERYDSTLFSAHAVQHLLLAMVAAPLLALGAPITLLLQSLPRRRRSRLLRVLHARPVAFATHPLVAFALFVASLFVLYFTPLYRTSLRNALVHEVVHVHFVLSGFLFFWPSLGLDPSRWRVAHALRVAGIALALPFHAFLGVAIMSSGQLLAGRTDDAVAASAAWGIDPLSDQRLGGALMWFAGDALAVVLLAFVAWRWLSAEERRVGAEDRAPPGERPTAASCGPPVERE